MTDILQEYEQAKKKAEQLEQEAKEQREALDKLKKEYLEAVKKEAEEKTRPLGYRLELVEIGKPKASKRTRTTLTDHDKAEMKKARSNGEKVKDIAEKYGCTVQAVYNAIK